MAILAGDSLLTLAFQVLAQLRCAGLTRKARLIAELAVAARHGRRHDRRTGGRSRRREASRRRRNCWRRSIAPRPGRCCAPVAAHGRDLRGRERSAVRRALLLRRTRRAGLPDRGRHSGCGGVVGGAREDGGQGRGSSTRSLSRRCTAWSVARMARGGMRARRTQVLAPLRRRARSACTNWPT